MESVFNVCAYFINSGIRERKYIGNIAIQKMLYFAQGFYLAENNKNQLFQDEIYAWQYGPVVKSVYHELKQFGNKEIKDLSEIPFVNPYLFDENKLSEQSRVFLNGIWDALKYYEPFRLVELTHAVGSPWYSIYQNYNGNIPKDIEIPIDEMYNYFCEKLVVSD